MKPDNSHLLLGGYAFGTLTRSEKDALMSAALDDPQLFEALVDEEEWRNAIQDPLFRQRLRRRLAATVPVEPAWKTRLAAFWRPQWITAAGLAAILTVVVLIRNGALQESSPIARVVLGSGAMPVLRAAGLLEDQTPRDAEIESDSRKEPPPAARGAGIQLDRSGSEPDYHEGDRMRIGFNMPGEFNAVLIEDRPDGESLRLFPNRFQSSPLVPAGTTVLIPPAGQGDLSVDGRAGRYTLRLLLFPRDVNPLENETAWSRLRSQAQISEKRFEVQP